MAVSKNMAVSIGKDKFIRIWEYSINTSLATTPLPNSSDAVETSYKQVSATQNPTLMYSISVHPLGNQLAVGIWEGIQIYYILEDECSLG